MKWFVAMLIAMVVVAVAINIHFVRRKRRAIYSIPAAYEIPPGVKKRKWRYIIIHHSATDHGNAARFDRYHREHMHMISLAYHFVIGNGSDSGDGEIEVGDRWIHQWAGGHCDRERFNEEGIGICLVGDFMKGVPTKRQMDSLVRLIKRLQKDFDIPVTNVLGHREINEKSTLCPGDNFPFEELITRLQCEPIALQTRKVQVAPEAKASAKADE